MLATSPVPVAATVGLAVLSVSAFLSFLRLSLGPTMPDRVVALDMIAVLLVGALVLDRVERSRPESMEVATVSTLVNFLGTVAFGIYLSRKASE